MLDRRLEDLAETILGHSLRLRAGETVLIEAMDLPDEALLRTLIERIGRLRAQVLVSRSTTTVLRELIRSARDEQLRLWAELDRARMERVDAYLSLQGAVSPYEWASVPPPAMTRYNDLYLRPVHWECRIPETRWCHVRLPGPSLAQRAGLPNEELEETFYNAVLIDYRRLRPIMQRLAEQMGGGRTVRIVREDTDLRFRLIEAPGVVCAGEKNLPDGEVFSAPVVDSMEGHIRFNTATFYQGSLYQGVLLEFEKGQVVRAECQAGDNAKLNRILGADDGACRIGEWAIGCNPKLHKPMADALFDEKLAGSHHLALGFAYPEADNGNRSRIHWDMVQILRPAWGGGEILLDGEPIVVDGLFVDPALDAMNPE